MKKILLNIFKLFKKIDISPLGRSYRYKVFIFVFWGLNALLFLAKDVAIECNICTDKDCNHKVACTLVKKIAKSDIQLETFELVYIPSYIIIPSEDYVLPETDFRIQPKDRSPPTCVL